MDDLTKPFIYDDEDEKEILKRTPTEKMVAIIAGEKVCKSSSWVPNAEMRAVLIMGSAFMLLFGAFDAQSFVVELSLRSIANATPNANIANFDGYYCTSILYFTFMLSVLFAPMIITRIGSKNAMAIGSLSFTVYLIAFQVFDRYVLFGTAMIVGMGSSLMWTAQSAYMKEITSEGRAERNNGIYWAILCFCLIIAGGIFTCVSYNADGSEFLSVSTIRFTYGFMAALTICANIVFFLLPNPPKTIEPPSEKKEAEGPIRELLSVLLLVRNKSFYYQIIAFCYFGIETGFFLAVLPTSFAFTERIQFASPAQVLACYAFANGVGEIAGGFIVGMISRRSASFGRKFAIFMGVVLQLTAFGLIFLSIPEKANLGPTNESGLLLEPSLWLAVVTTVIFAVGDSAMKVVRGTVLTTAFRTQDTAKACALSRIFQSLGNSGILFASSMITLRVHLIILSVLLIATTLCFISVTIVERKLTAGRIAAKKKNQAFLRKITVNVI